MFLSVSTNVMGSQMCAATDCDSVGDDGLQCLRGDLQQASHPAGLGLTEDASHLKRLALEKKKHLHKLITLDLSDSQPLFHKHRPHMS